MMGDGANADTAVAAAATSSSGRNNMIGRSLMLHKLLLAGGNWDGDALTSSSWILACSMFVDGLLMGVCRVCSKLGDGAGGVFQEKLFQKKTASSRTKNESPSSLIDGRSP